MICIASKPHRSLSTFFANYQPTKQAAMSASQPQQTVPETSAKKIIPLSEISKHKTVDDLWMAVNGKVYDVTSFVDQHPGGEEVLLEYAGTDATGPFEDVGHSESAQEMLADLYIGEGNPEELKVVQKKEAEPLSTSTGGSSNLVIVAFIAVLAIAYYYLKAMKE